MTTYIDYGASMLIPREALHENNSLIEHFQSLSSTDYMAGHIYTTMVYDNTNNDNFKIARDNRIVSYELWFNNENQQWEFFDKVTGAKLSAYPVIKDEIEESRIIKIFKAGLEKI